jgi:hypothetical protein
VDAQEHRTFVMSQGRQGSALPDEEEAAGKRRSRCLADLARQTDILAKAATKRRNAQRKLAKSARSPKIRLSEKK